MKHFQFLYGPHRINFWSDSIENAYSMLMQMPFNNMDSLIHNPNASEEEALGEYDLTGGETIH